MNATKAPGSWLPFMALGQGQLEQVYAMPVHFRYPAYHVAQPSIFPFVSDKYLSLLSPIIAYWVVSAWFCFLDTMQFPFFEKYRLHEPEEISKRNRVSAFKVLIMVVLQQLIQTGLGILILEGEETSLAQVFADHEGNVRSLAQRFARLVVSTVGMTSGMKVLHALGPWFANWLYWWGIPAVQMFWAL